MAGDWAGTVRDDLAADVRRVVERLRTLSQAQLVAPAPPHSSRAAGARAVAQALATAAQGIEDRASPDEPHWRTLPELADLAVGDQVAVTGHDLLALLLTPPSPGDHAVVGVVVDPEETVWAPGARRTAGEVVADTAARLATLRRLL